VNVALKEWAAVVEELAVGRQILLLRKGGIAEPGNRGFQVRHQEFLLFPTFEHQQAGLLRPECRDVYERVAAAADPAAVRITHLAQVASAIPAPPLEALRYCSKHYVWSDELLRQRYEYRPDLTLMLIVARVFRLARPATIPLRASYAGCKSWVNLTEQIDVEGARAVLSEDQFAAAWKGVTEDLGRYVETASPAKR